MARWKVEAVVDRSAQGKGALSWVGFVDAETRDEAQHVGRARCIASATVDTKEAFKGATIIVEPAQGRGWR